LVSVLPMLLQGLKSMSQRKPALQPGD
jgi:hypothetical protein